MSAPTSSPICVVLALGPAADNYVTGLTLAERGRRVAVRAGVPADRVHVVRAAADLARARAAAADAPLVVLDASDHVVAAQLIDPLRLTEPGTRLAYRAGAYVSALRADGAEATAVWDALTADLDDRGVTIATTLAATAEQVEVNDRARHPGRTKDDLRGADAWQWELVNKKLDSFLTVYFYRVISKPLTRMFLRTPLSPNMITVLSTALSIVGCVIGTRADWQSHVIGMAMLVAGGIIDCNDGEVARLRLEGSTLGGWLDAIGDDMSRLALILAVGMHIAPRYPDLPIHAITGAVIGATLLTLGLIYWYCIFVIKSSNNQDYTNVLGIGPGQGETTQRSIGRVIADWASQIVRRDFIDAAALVLALVNLPEILAVGLAAGAVVTVIIVIPTHFKIVRMRREARAAA
ncbi:MAG: CDP-alcohol phosphatidyltransferase family protein [Myxococcales bacterium]|nr:CDP-alcohol phosphatidyltransferase family protein [Myxococcales bacterium]